MNTRYTNVVGVAQLVEPRIVIPVVVGSSPIVHPSVSFLLKYSLFILFFQVLWCAFLRFAQRRFA